MLELVLLVVALVVSWTLLGHLFDASIAATPDGRDGRDACPTCGATLEQLGWLGTVVLQDGKEVEGTERLRLLECPSCLGEFHEEPDGTLTPR